MRISAKVFNAPHEHEVTVETDGLGRALTIPPRETGSGSSVNGGELLFLALATCYCNDVYREAAAEGVTIDAVEVTVSGVFEGRGAAARDLRYDVTVRSPDRADRVEALLRATDGVAEVQNTLRGGVAVALGDVRVQASDAGRG